MKILITSISADVNSIYKLYNEITKTKKYNIELLFINNLSKKENDKLLKKVQKNKGYAKFTYIINDSKYFYGKFKKLSFDYATKNNFDYILNIDFFDQELVKNLSKIIKSFSRKKIIQIIENKSIYTKIFLKFFNLENLKIGNINSIIQAYDVFLIRNINYKLNSNSLLFNYEILLQHMLFDAKVLQFYYPKKNRIKKNRNIPIRRFFIESIFFKLCNFKIFFKNKYYVPNKYQKNYSNKLSFDSSHRYSINVIPKKSKILDIACQDGNIGKYLIDNKQCYVVGIDKYQHKNVKYLSNFFKIDLNKKKIGLDLNKFDYILLLDLIEHLNDPEDFMKYISHKLFNSETKIIISTPNIANIIIRISLLMGSFNYGPSGILDKTHTRLFTLSSLKRLIKESDFEIEKIIATPIPFPLALGDNFLSKILIFINKVLIFISKGLFGFQNIVVCKVKKNNEILTRSVI